MRPGHTVFDRRLDSDGTVSLAHAGKTYTADLDGWFDLPEEVGRYFLSYPGWRTPEMIDADVVAGLMKAEAADSLPAPKPIVKARSRAAA